LYWIIFQEESRSSSHKDLGIVVGVVVFSSEPFKIETTKVGCIQISTSALLELSLSQNQSTFNS
jgi:hypothetical protein